MTESGPHFNDMPVAAAENYEVPKPHLYDQLKQERTDRLNREAAASAGYIVKASRVRVENSLNLSLEQGEGEDKAAVALAESGSLSSKFLPPDESRRMVSVFGNMAGMEKEQNLPADPEWAKDDRGRSIVPLSNNVQAHIGSVDGDRVDYSIHINNDVPPENRLQAAQEFFTAANAHFAPFNEAMDELSTRIDPQQGEAFTDTTFSFKDDLNVLRNFISKADTRAVLVPLTEKRDGVVKPISDAKLLTSTIDALYDHSKMHHYYPGDKAEDTKRQGLYFDENGRFQEILLDTGRPGVYMALRSAHPEQGGDLSELPLQPGIRFAADEIQSERSYTNLRSQEAPAFIDTPAAYELVNALEGAGLDMSLELRNAIIEDPSIQKRYGHGYAELTREIAKNVSNPNRSIAQLLSVSGEAYEDSSALERRQAVAQRLLGLEDVADPGAQIVLSMLRDVAKRNLAAEGAAGAGAEITAPAILPELPASNEKIEIRNGSCKDIEFYLARGHNVPAEEGRAPLLRQSSYKVPTVMTLAPVTYRGVTLPGGSLFRIANDGGFVFQRITSFAFSTEQAKQIFGPQELENSEATDLEPTRQLVRQQ